MNWVLLFLSLSAAYTLGCITTAIILRNKKQRKDFYKGNEKMLKLKK